MRDYVYPSIFFAYFFFLIAFAVALYFFFRTMKDGYWGERSEDPKYRMLEEEESVEPNARRQA